MSTHLELERQVQQLPVIDNHCHRTLAEHTRLDLPDWRLQFTEASHAGPEGADVTSTVRYLRTLRRLARYYGVEESEKAVLAARSSREPTELRRELFADAGLTAVLYDEGYPSAELVDKDEGRVAQRTVGAGPIDGSPDTQVHTLQRVETFLDQAAATSEDLDDVVDLARQEWADIRANGHVGLKSAIAYRTGLVLDDWTLAEVRDAFAAHKRSGSTRVVSKPVCDFITDLALRAAAGQRCPVQIHTGYGDEDVDLRLAHPLQVRQWVQREGFRGAPLVLLHGSFPYTAEAAYLASVYGDVHLDVSFGIPHTAVAQLREVAFAALGQAPARKVLYSSDAYCIPELHWMSAVDAKQVTTDVLSRFLADGDLRLGQALDVASGFFADNAQRLYELPRPSPTAATEPLEVGP